MSAGVLDNVYSGMYRDVFHCVLLEEWFALLPFLFLVPARSTFVSHLPTNTNKQSRADAHTASFSLHKARIV